MRGLAVLCLAACLLTLALGAAALDDDVKHFNPSLLEARMPNPIKLGLLLSSLAKGFERLNVSETLELARTLRGLYAPVSVRPLLERFSQLVEEQGLSLGNVSRLLELAKEMLFRGELSSARSALSHVLEEVASAYLRQHGLNASARELERVYKASYTQVADASNKALEKALAEALELARVLEESPSKPRCSLEIDVAERSVPVGGHLTLTARVTIEGLQDEVNGLLKILLETPGNRVLGLSEAPLRGTPPLYANLSVRVPYVYEKPLLVYGLLSPMDGSFVPCASEKVPLTPVWIEPEVNVTVKPSRVLRGLEVMVEISLRSPTRLNATVRFADVTVPLVLVEGVRVVTVRTPEYLKPGYYEVALLTAPLGVVGPSTRRAAVEVVAYQSALELTAPRWVLAGTESRVKVCAWILQEQHKVPLREGFKAALVAPGTQSVVESDSPCASARLKTPLSVPGGRVRVQVMLEPRVPWVERTSSFLELTVVNPIALLASLSLLFGTLVLVVRGKRGGDGKKAEVALEEKVERRDRYWAEGGGPAQTFLALLTMATGISRRPWQTLREYYRCIERRLGELSGLVWRLVLLLEAVLYGGKKSVAKDLEEDLEILRKTLGRGRSA